jgi:L-alanine-DL-glutamate epimerase-like enolase superfamily enzyme
VSFVDLGPHKFITGGITIKSGHAYLPDAAGLGIDVDWDSLAEHSRAGFDR